MSALRLLIAVYNKVIVLDILKEGHHKPIIRLGKEEAVKALSEVADELLSRKAGCGG